MAVAVKNSPEASTKKLTDHLGVAALFGTLFVVATLMLVFKGVPKLWEVIGGGTSPAAVVARWLVQLAAFGGAVYLGVRAKTEFRPGLKAGIVVGLVGVLFALWFACVLGNSAFAGLAPGAGLALTIGAFVAQLAGIVYLYSREGVQEKLVDIEGMGWFSLKRYKASQGQRVRRLTMLALLILAAAGVYSMIANDTLATVGDWVLRIPFTEDFGWIKLELLPDVRLTLPLLLAVGALWLSFRVVNLPVFADFLIATEAEMNKVSWTTRKRLVQDTIVVLVTVFLMTLFLFTVDQLWARALSAIGVLNIPQGQQTQTDTGKDLKW